DGIRDRTVTGVQTCALPSCKLTDRLSKRGASDQGYDAPALDRLTKRETEVLVLVGQGARNKGIAEMLGISANTTRVHVRNIKQRSEERRVGKECVPYSRVR